MQKQGSLDKQEQGEKSAAKLLIAPAIIVTVIFVVLNLIVLTG